MSKTEPKKIRFYVAASFARRDEAIELAKAVTNLSGQNVQFELTSRWLGGNRPNTNYGDSPQWGIEDLEDVVSADVQIQIVNDTPPFAVNRGTDDLPRWEVDPGNGTRGGRHTELGVALISQIPVILYTFSGTREQVFHHHPLVMVVRELGELRAALEALARYGTLRVMFREPRDQK